MTGKLLSTASTQDPNHLDTNVCCVIRLAGHRRLKHFIRTNLHHQLCVGESCIRERALPTQKRFVRAGKPATTMKRQTRLDLLTDRTLLF